MHTTFKIAIRIVLLIAVTAAFTFAGQPAKPAGTPSPDEIKASLEQAPKAVFPQLSFKFEPVFEGMEIKHDFVIENSGEAPLVIKNIRPD